MKKDIEKLHVLSAFILNLTLLIITFITNNPIIIFSVFILCFIVMVVSGNIRKASDGLLVFIPMGVITVTINMIFAGQGRTVLFNILGRNFTLEAFIYAIILSFKILLIVYIFILFSIFVDSDNAVSYFSKHVPKSTLVMLISLKLFPNMKKRFESLKQIYSIRGVNYEGTTIKAKIKSYIPIISILLEDSLEGSFDIGEAAYVRGFLSSRRTAYDIQILNNRDLFIVILSLLLFGLHIFMQAAGFDNYDVYNNISIYTAVNIFSYISIVIMFTLLLLLIRIRSKK